MNINYHYYTVKTLAVLAGFEEDEAEVVAHFSQLIDDFILSHLIIIQETPPQFFVDNELACQLGDGKWLFMPCTTGIDYLRALTYDYQRCVLVPFHFLPDQTLPEIEHGNYFFRTDYRCIAAGGGTGGLALQLLGEAAGRVKVERSSKNLIELGMMLHTFADTFAHTNFSGFYGYENRAKIVQAYSEKWNKDVMSEWEYFLYQLAPNIGHGDVGSIPDRCDLKIAFRMQSFEHSGLDVLIQRDNSQQFAVCSRMILDMLFMILDRPLLSDVDWSDLQKLLVKAQFAPREDEVSLQKSYQKIFPNIHYHYQKSRYFNLEFSLEQLSELLKENVALLEAAILDAYSLEGNAARKKEFVFLKEAGEIFFTFNELAYQRIRKVVGYYATLESKRQIKDVCHKYNKQK
jgi:hypothetical protein